VSILVYDAFITVSCRNENVADSIGTKATNVGRSGNERV
jgi:hypothetical protein